MTNKYSINLLQAELLPTVPLLSLKRVVSTWILVLVLMLMIIALGKYQLVGAAQKNAQLNNQKAQKVAQQSALSLKLSQRKTDPVLVEKLSTLKMLTNSKRVLHASLTDGSKTYVAGFAKAMTELAGIHQTNVSLNTISISHDQMSFSGLARTPDAVPLWMAGFRQASLLSGKHFTHFKLSENEQHLTEFVVSSKASVESK